MDTILITQLGFTIYISILLSIHEFCLIKKYFCRDEPENTDDVFNIPNNLLEPHLPVSVLPSYSMPVINLPETIKSDRVISERNLNV